MQISLFNSTDATTHRSLSLTWDEVVTALSTPNYTPCAPCPRGNRCRHKATGELFSPVSFLPGKSREKGKTAKNIDFVYFLVYDLDHLSTDELQKIGEKLNGIQSFTYSSHSDSPDLDDRCFRLLVNLSRPVTNAEWHVLYFKFAEHLGLKDLGGAKDIGRMFFTPSTPEGQEFFTAREDGEVLDPSLWLRVTVPSSETIDTDPIDYQHFLDRIRVLIKKKNNIGSDEACTMARLYQDALEGKPLLKDGSRESALKSITLSLLSSFGAKYKDTIRFFLRASCIAMGDDSPNNSYLDILDYKLDRDEDLGEANFQEKLDRSLARAAEALATLPKPENPPEIEETGDEVLDSFNRSFFLGWNAQRNQECYYRETGDEVIMIPRESIAIATKPIRKKIGEDKSIPGFQHWEGSTRRRHYERVHFAPQQKLPPTEYNLFKGYGVTAKEVDYPLFREFWHDVICDANDELYRYQVTWVAQMLQRPYDPPGIALVLHSDIHGTGKGTFVEALGKIVGRAHYVTESDLSKVLEGFSGHLEKSILINIDESQSSPSRKLLDAMKNFITSPTRQIEHKGMARYTCSNFAHLIITTNNLDAIRIDPSDRRMACFGVSTKRVGDREYFNKLYHEIRNTEAMNGLFKDLMEFDLEKDGADLRDIPETETRKTMRQTSISEVAAFWQNFLQTTQDKSCSLTVQHQEYLMTKPRYQASLVQFSAEVRFLCSSGKEALLSTQAGRKIMFSFDLTQARQDFEKATHTHPKWMDQEVVEPMSATNKGWNLN